MEAMGQGWSPRKDFLPEDYGFNAIRLTGCQPGRKVSAAVTASAQARRQGGLRYGLVAVTAAGKSVYGRPAAKGSVSMKLPAEPLKAVYLVVMGAPAQHKRLSWDSKEPNRQYPYTVTFTSGVHPE